MEPSAHKAGRNAHEKEPPVGVPVWVQCDGYRCLAVRNRHGEWKTYHNHKPLTNVVRVLGPLEAH